MKTKVKYKTSWPKNETLAKNSLLIFDQRLPRFSNDFDHWRAQFRNAYPVKAGEGLKDISHFPRHAERVLKLIQPISGKDLRMVVVGGGTVGDFGAFMASVIKRGVALTHVPSTWLAAIDSSHGGKTGLNVGAYKNQVGTFYPADEILLIKSLLVEQPAVRAQEAVGELVKMAIIDGGKWVKDLQASKRSGNELLWKFLPFAVTAKYKVVDQDPLEQTGVRRILNLGHTLAHVFELEHGLAHGEAVGVGLRFAVEWSAERGYLSSSQEDQMIQLMNRFLRNNLEDRLLRKPLTSKKFTDLCLQDKKRTQKGEVDFIFTRGFGRNYRKSVKVREILNQVKRRGWVK